MRSFIFPLAVMSNLFAMMVLTIGLSLFGKPALSAEIGLVHGATVALFYSFSGNARSLILADAGDLWAARILRLRFVLVLPLCVLAWLLCIGVLTDGALFIWLLILRRAAEWLAEVFLSEYELRERLDRSVAFFVLQGAGLCVVLSALLLDLWALPVTFLWACSPLLICFDPALIQRALGRDASTLHGLRTLLPHFGSTLAIGISVYVFRLFIVLLVGKEEAGDLFAAFALGGILGAVFSQALGPTMIRHERQSAGARFARFFNGMLIGVLLLGIALGGVIWRMPGLMEWTAKSNFFWIAVSCSLVGGVVMVLAQRVRLRLLQGGGGRDVFGSDVLANLLLICCVPLFFFAAGDLYLAPLYLVGALISLAFYLSEDWVGVMKNYKGHFMLKKIPGVFERQATFRSWMVVLLVCGLFAPVFFQLGHGLFLGGGNFRSNGSLALLPIPVSVFFCYAGVVVLGSYARARTALVIIFFTFVGMLLSVLLVSAEGPASVERGKLILLIQFLLPMFALVLGLQFGSAADAVLRLARVLLVVLLVVVVLQVVATAWALDSRLSSSAFLFGVYQHLQYVPVIFSGGFLITLYSLWGDPSKHVWLMLLAGLIGLYVVLSVSMLAMLLLLVGVLCFSTRCLIVGIYRGRSGLLASLVILGGRWVFCTYTIRVLSPPSSSF
ncbi:MULTISPECIES: hypothetical protein [Pseudomonas]|uniref:Uncharacterized protein n=1 Tax=Pseudomonas mosselii TaxID=78327 RepID=A0A5R8Z8D2_9PSED|nr:hypothetical protein [Pseudomonas mosselii]TLP61156.1 hypothetical protein FEM01_11240 [Pseudomonas mosselii]